MGKFTGNSLGNGLDLAPKAKATKAKHTNGITSNKASSQKKERSTRWKGNLWYEGIFLPIISDKVLILYTHTHTQVCVHA